MRSEIANDDALAGRLFKETFVTGKRLPIFVVTAFGDTGGRLVVDDLIPQITKETIFVGILRKLAAEAPDGAIVELGAVEAHKIPL